MKKQHIDEIEPAVMKDLKQMSTLKTPHNAIAVVPMPDDLSDPMNIMKSLISCS